MPNKIINDDNVKWHSKKKYPCKRNKGEHEWGEPTIKHERYSHAEISMMLETRCIHCGKKVLTFIWDV